MQRARIWSHAKLETQKNSRPISTKNDGLKTIKPVMPLKELLNYRVRLLNSLSVGTFAQRSNEWQRAFKFSPKLPQKEHLTVTDAADNKLLPKNQDYSLIPCLFLVFKRMKRELGWCLMASKMSNPFPPQSVQIAHRWFPLFHLDAILKAKQYLPAYFIELKVLVNSRTNLDWAMIRHSKNANTIIARTSEGIHWDTMHLLILTNPGWL